MRKSTILLGSILMMQLSCNRQSEIIQEKEITNQIVDSKSVQKMKEFSQLLGKALVTKESRMYVVDLIRDRNDNSEAITVNALLGKNISDKERKLLNKTFSKKNVINPLKSALVSEFRENIDSYPLLKEELGVNNKRMLSSRSIDEIYDKISDYYSSQGLSIYFPYEENFDLEKERDLTVTWNPMSNQDWNSAYITSIRGRELMHIDRIDDDYAYDNPTLVVTPIDFIGDDLENPITDDWRKPENNPPSWEFKGWQGFLTFNVDHTKIVDEDVLKVNIPRIRLMEHLATWFTPTTITIIRSSANLTTDSNNQLVYPLSSDSRSVLTKHNIKRKYARNKSWVSVNILWDDDWNMHEVEHNLTWASHHTFRGNLNVSGNVKLGWDTENKKTTVEPKIDVAFNVKVGGNCRLEYNNNVSRRAVLTQVVGDTGAGTYNDNGVHYSVRTAGKMQYYFKPYLTKIK